MKIYLIGYMGSGKSTIGKLLSDQLKLDFIDLDKYIEHETGKSITEIFAQNGEAGFRVMEHDYLKKVVTKDNMVVSLGGGTPCFHNNIDLINKNGTSVYLDVDLDVLTKRLSKEKNDRPLIKNLNDTELKSFIERNLEKRETIYKQASIIIKVKTLDKDELVEKIKRKITI